MQVEYSRDETQKYETKNGDKSRKIFHVHEIGEILTAKHNITKLAVIG